jgi:hypothetical protein
VLVLTPSLPVRRQLLRRALPGALRLNGEIFPDWHEKRWFGDKYFTEEQHFRTARNRNTAGQMRLSGLS